MTSRKSASKTIQSTFLNFQKNGGQASQFNQTDRSTTIIQLIEPIEFEQINRPSFYETSTRTFISTRGRGVAKPTKKKQSKNSFKSKKTSRSKNTFRISANRPSGEQQKNVSMIDIISAATATEKLNSFFETDDVRLMTKLDQFLSFTKRFNARKLILSLENTEKGKNSNEKTNDSDDDKSMEKKISANTSIKFIVFYDFEKIFSEMNDIFFVRIFKKKKFFLKKLRADLVLRRLIINNFNEQFIIMRKMINYTITKIKINDKNKKYRIFRKTSMKTKNIVYKQK